MLTDILLNLISLFAAYGAIRPHWVKNQRCFFNINNVGIFLYITIINIEVLLSKKTHGMCFW